MTSSRLTSLENLVFDLHTLLEKAGCGVQEVVGIRVVLVDNDEAGILLVVGFPILVTVPPEK